MELISEIQQRFIEENKGTLLEFYSRINDDASQERITKDTEIWIYNLDRNEFTPHCHIFNKEKTEEIEVSLIDWSIINVKNPNNKTCDWSDFKVFKNRFFKWLTMPDELGNTNSFKLFSEWDRNNQKDRLHSFLEKRRIENISEELKDYFNQRTKFLKSIYKQVHNALFAAFYTNGMNFPFKKYSPIELLKQLDIDINIDEEDKEAVNAVTQAEDFVQKTLYGEK